MAKPPVTPEAAPLTPRPWARTRRALILGTVLVGALGTAWSIGRLQGLSPLWEAQKLTQTAQSAQETVEKERLQEHQKVQLLEARRRLDLADIEVDRRNFGTAHDHLATAGKLLSKVDPLTPELSQFAERLRKTSLVAAENSAEAHRKLLDLTFEFDRLMPPMAP